MSLADELLADLEEMAEHGDAIEFNDDQDNELDTIEDVAMDIDNKLDSVKNIAKLRDGEQLCSIMSRIKRFQENPRKGEVVGPVEADPEYLLIVEANNISVEIDNEINSFGVSAAFDLNESKSQILSYVESRMSFISPNLSIIVGASTAAKIMGAAGGLTNLSKMPSCNVLLLGAQKRTLSGFSSATLLPHTGFIYYSDLCQGTPPDLRKKAARLIAGKCTLAARVDSFHESPNGEIGSKFREEIDGKFEKLTEPPPVKKTKALPAPIDGGRKKRGGRRYRKMKERLGMTEFRKAANRMTFGEIEDDAYQEDLGFSLGQVKKTGTGRIRGPQVDNKTQVKISKSLQRQLQKQQMHGGRSTVKGRETSGTASSVAFTPLQGLEIFNPNAAEKKVAEANARYFSATTGFQKVKNEAT
ncbi:U4/U6 small nuclear ribonucleoprotein Prp31-like [Anneissia japonica]|uniref:U4/U6 small nuclear ribonucleoprotein Prp31-like n=1 Tax=Anneissia japonica TaxID=1529436 RepID=UPI001425B4B5|nr:U4/U6 small nuclear ribonucleoprotein Prp31-like [Anneissia japonica]